MQSSFDECLRNTTCSHTHTCTPPGPSSMPVYSEIQGLILVILGCASFLVFCYASILSKILPSSENRFLSAVRNDWYYCRLVPLTLPILVIAVYLHWLSMKLFKHA